MPLQNRIEPEAPELKTPWRTEARIELQTEARVFARDIVLPIADDPQKGEMPKSLVDRMGAKGRFGITIPAEHGGMGLGIFEYCLVSEELARAWLSVGSILARGQGLGTQTIDETHRLELCAARLKVNGSVRLHCQSQPPAQIWPRFRPEPSARTITGSYPEPNDGRALRLPPTSSR